MKCKNRCGVRWQKGKVADKKNEGRTGIYIKMIKAQTLGMPISQSRGAMQCSDWSIAKQNQGILPEDLQIIMPQRLRPDYWFSVFTSKVQSDWKRNWSDPHLLYSTDYWTGPSHWLPLVGPVQQTILHVYMSMGCFTDKLQKLGFGQRISCLSLSLSVTLLIQLRGEGAEINF